MTRRIQSAALSLFGLLVVLSVGPAMAQMPPGDEPPPPPPPPPSAVGPAAPAPLPRSAEQLGQLVRRIALYPDPLLAQVLTASTYWDEIPEAADWARRHGYLRGDALAAAIQEDGLRWAPSVLALLPFPSVLDAMAKDPAWTEELGRAVLTQRAEVMDAVQGMRREAYRYGYLRTNPYNRVADAGGSIEVLPVNPAYVYVPAYDPFVVFGPPPPGILVGGAVHVAPAVVIAAGFYPWGWAHPYLAWSSHLIYFDETPWGRGWANRVYYAHSYAHPPARQAGHRTERHEQRR